MSKGRVEIFQLGSPAAFNRHFGADAGCPSLVQVKDLIDVIRRTRALEKAAQGPRNSAGRVDHPLRERIAETAADGGHVIDFLRAVDIHPCARPGHIIGREVVRKGCVGFNSE